MSIFERRPQAARSPDTESTPGEESGLTQAVVLNELMNEGATVIERPTDYIAPALNYSGIESEMPKFAPHLARYANDCAKACGSYLSGALITDSFGNEHLKRREWRYEMQQKYGDAFTEMYKTNKLRINSIAWVQTNLNGFANSLRVFEVHSQKADAVQALATQFPEYSNYEKMTDEEKITVVRQIETICKSFFEIMTKE